MAGWVELSDLVLRISWVGEEKAIIFLVKHSARKFLLTPLRIRGEGPTFPTPLGPKAQLENFRNIWFVDFVEEPGSIHIG